MMDPIAYRDGTLCMEEVALTRIAEAVGTPAYVYSSRAMETRLTEFQRALAGLDSLVCYALKANSNLAVIRTFAALGAGADVVSLGELRQALAAGVPAARIVFAGVGKTAAEMAPAIDADIMMFNVESESELRLLSRVAESKDASVAIAVRVNPDVDAGTHDKIATGRRQDKFGVGWRRAPEIYDLAARLPGLRVQGVAIHIGSQLTSLAPFEAAFRRVAELAETLLGAGHEIRHLDLGGGLGINYKDETPPAPEAYAEVVRRTVGDLGLRLIFEPGRYLVGNAGVLLSRVVHVKDEGRRFVILDAAMNDLIRPALYEAWHDILPVAEPDPAAVLAPATFAGPICESGDVLADQRPAPPLAADDLISIGSAGAYAAVMASTYNSRPLAPEILVKGDRFAVVRRRQSVEELVSRDSLPPWLDGALGEAARGVA